MIYLTPMHSIQYVCKFSVSKIYNVTCYFSDYFLNFGLLQYIVI